MTHGHKLTLKDLDEEFISSSIKREYTIGMNMLELIGLKHVTIYSGGL